MLTNAVYQREVKRKLQETQNSQI